MTHLKAILLGVVVCAAVLPNVQAQVLRSRLNADIRSTDPGTNRDENTDAVLLHVVEGLVAYREDLSIGPLLAESYEVAADGLTYSFHLRAGVKFHNGANMTSADVVWSFKRYLNPQTHWRCLPELDAHGPAHVLSVQAEGPRDVKVTLEHPSAMFLPTLARADCGETGILHKDSIDAEGKWVAPIGTGPFKLARWKPGEMIELERFAAYASLPGPRDGNTGGKHPAVDKIQFIIIPDNSAAVAALLSHAIDILDGVAPANLPQLAGRTDIRLEKNPTMEDYALVLQTRDPLLQDVRMRRAIAAAIDTAGLAEAASQATAIPNNSAVPVSSAYYGPVEKTGFRHDTSLALRLLKEAGYHGQPIRLVTTKRYPQLFDAAVTAQAMAQDAGITFELDVVDWATELDRYNRGDYQALSFSYSARLDPALSFDAIMGPKATQPRKVWDDPGAQALLEQLMTTAEPAQRRTLIDELHRRLIDQVPLIIYSNPVHVAAVRSAVQGFHGWATVQQRLWDVSLH